jgi:hypothetical protein
MRVFERVERMRKYSEMQVQVLDDHYLNSTEILLAFKSSKRHFAYDLIDFLNQGVMYMNAVIDKKIKNLTNPQEYTSNSKTRNSTMNVKASL